MLLVVDLSHPVEHGMITYPGLPAPAISDHLGREQSRDHYAPGTTFQIGRIEMIGNTGTYVDAPFHRFEHGIDIAEMPLDRLVDLDGIVIEPCDPQGQAIDRDSFVDHDLHGKAVLVHTGWSAKFGTPQYAVGHPFLTRPAAEHLADSGVALVGIDSLNIDDATDGERPAHTILLSAGIPIVEHLRNLEALPRKGFRFFAAPVPVRGMGSFPVRAFATVPERSE